MANDIRFGVIGGSGVYSIEALQDVKEIEVDTPFGKPSDAYITGTLDGVKAHYEALMSLYQPADFGQGKGSQPKSDQKKDK